VKNRDFLRLAGYSLRSNKRQTKNTVRGIAFGVTLLVTLFFVLLAFYGGAMAGIDREKVLSSYRLEYELRNKETAKINQRIKKEILNNPSITESIIYKPISILYFENGDFLYPTISIGGTDYLYDYHYSDVLEKWGDVFHFFDLHNSTTLITAEEEEFLKRNNYGEALLAGTLFSENTDEIIVASHVLDYFEIDYREALGKKLSYSVNLTTGYRAFRPDGSGYYKDLLGNQVCVVRDFTIVGVYNSNLYLSPSRGEDLYYAPTFWLKLDSLYLTEDIEFLYGEEQIEGFIYNKDPLAVFQDAAEAKKAAIPYGFNTLSSINDLRYMCDFCQIIQFADFRSAYEFYNNLEYYLYKYQHFGFFESHVLSDYRQFYPLIMLVSTIFLIFGGVVFFVTVLNLYNTMRYSVEKRKGYLAMCRAMGMNRRDVLKLYFFETGLVLFRAALWIIVFSLLLSAGITILINDALISSALETTVSYRFHLVYYPFVLIPCLAILLLLALLIARMVSGRKTRENMLVLLNRSY
jgi:ABC-type antimicrobial peptide transport system permease subunit